MTNLEVVKAWGRQEHGHSPNMHTDGKRLYSYALQIGEWRDGLPVVFNFTAHVDGNPFGHRVPSERFVSKTTSYHVGLARRVGYAFVKGDVVLGADRVIIHAPSLAERNVA